MLYWNVCSILGTSECNRCPHNLDQPLHSLAITETLPAWCSRATRYWISDEGYTIETQPLLAITVTKLARFSTISERDSHAWQAVTSVTSCDHIGCCAHEKLDLACINDVTSVRHLGLIYRPERRLYSKLLLSVFSTDGTNTTSVLSACSTDSTVAT